METAVTIATLALLLAALLVVNKARGEAKAEREAARAEVASQRDEARAVLAEVQRREERVAAEEEKVAADRHAARHYVASLEERVAAVILQEESVAAERKRLSSEIEARLAAVAELSADQARAELRASLLADAEATAAHEAHRIVRKAKDDAEARARRILAEAMQHIAGSAAAQASVTRVRLPSEEMKGRIIGREGRNIRSFEALTGVNVIVDEGVDAVLLSSFDVERREVAAAALADLLADGRIQPHRVEAAYAKALAEAPSRAADAAMEAIERAGVGPMPPAIVELLGALRLRTSYGQVVLDHLVETALIAASVATEIGADVALARRAGFLHDIGKALTGQREGTHAALGASVAAEAGESALVVNAIAAHHDEIAQLSVEAVIVQIADAISAARPGARRGEAESYVERMSALEALVASQPGVDHVFAMASGRELRVVVRPDEVSDEGTGALARAVVSSIEKDASFAGEIRVTVIRQTRADFVAGQA